MPDFDICECISLEEEEDNECKLHCPEFLGLALDPEHCECVSVEVEDCPEGTYLDDRKGWCSPLEWCDRECGRGQILNAMTCKCETFEGHEVDDDDFYCDIHISCPPGSTFDNQTCSCVQDTFGCSLQCPDFLGLVLDEEACECVHTDECTLVACDCGMYVDEEACECVWINDEC